MEILDTPLVGLKFVRLQPHRDDRGVFARIADIETFQALGAGPVAQVNISITGSKGTVRGIHMQTPPACGSKLVVCLRGKVWDVAVDLRLGSPTLRKWHGTELGPMEAFLLPPGCAHGFQVLEGPAEILYLMSETYCKAAEFRVHPLDPTLGVGWPLSIGKLSEPDRAAPLLATDFPGVSP
jgi:dTDP-4-dehydrorhamnose 3,5-epimerase